MSSHKYIERNLYMHLVKVFPLFGHAKGRTWCEGRARWHVRMKPALVTPCLLLYVCMYIMCVGLFAWRCACVRFGLVENAKQKHKKCASEINKRTTEKTRLRRRCPWIFKSAHKCLCLRVFSSYYGFVNISFTLKTETSLDQTSTDF